jgi:hypothetical protein
VGNIEILGLFVIAMFVLFGLLKRFWPKRTDDERTTASRCRPVDSRKYSPMGDYLVLGQKLKSTRLPQASISML